MAIITGWQIADGIIYDTEDGQRIAEMCDNATPEQGTILAAAPELLEALERTAKLIKTARQYFPRYIQNSDRFDLENTAATVGKALHKAKGGTI